MLWMASGQPMPMHGMHVPAGADECSFGAGWPLQACLAQGTGAALDTPHFAPAWQHSWHAAVEPSTGGEAVNHSGSSMEVFKSGAPIAQRQRKPRRPKTQHGQSAPALHSEAGVACVGQVDEVVEEGAGTEGEAAVCIQAMAEEILDELRGARTESATSRFVHMAFADEVSSRAAQRAIEAASAAEQVALSYGLHGQVIEAMRSKHANYVITKAIEVMPVDRVGFIAEELLGRGSEVARHRFGCRVLCRILEHLSPRDEASMRLLDEVLVDAERLCIHAFGSIVMRHFLEHGLAQHKRRVAAALLQDVAACAVQRKGSHVVEEADRKRVV